MALTPCMSCMKQCGYLCGLLAALNIWFWIGMTIFNAMGNPWIKKEVLLMDSYTADTSKYTTVFAICIVVSNKSRACSNRVPYLSNPRLRLLLASSTSSALSPAAGAPSPSATRTKTPSSTTLRT